MSITVRGTNAKTREQVIKAVEAEPQYVEIASTSSGFAYKGYLDKLPALGKVYATQGKLSMVFWREGRRVHAA